MNNTSQLNSIKFLSKALFSSSLGKMKSLLSRRDLNNYKVGKLKKNLNPLSSDRRPNRLTDDHITYNEKQIRTYQINARNGMERRTHHTLLLSPCSRMPDKDRHRSKVIMTQLNKEVDCQNKS